MEVIKLQEFTVFAACFLSGIIIGSVFDFFRAWRLCFDTTDGMVAFQDILFWLIACLVVYGAIYFTNGAELRWFEPVGLSVGVVAYIPLLSRHCVIIFSSFLSGLEMFVGAVLKPVSVIRRVVDGIGNTVFGYVSAKKQRILCKLHKVFLKTTHKSRVYGMNICKKFFFTFLKR